MKRIVAIVMTVLMLLAVLAPVASAATASPVKKYEDAQAGELLYTVNFNGDSAFQPARLDLEDGQMDYEIVENGAGVRIHAKQGAEDRKMNLWGGLIKDLEATDQTIYSMVYKAKANTIAGNIEPKNNTVGVGGWAVSEEGFQLTNGVYNVYSNHNTKNANGENDVNQRAALSEGIMKIGDIDNDADGNNGYKYIKDYPAYDVDDDGFMTVLVVYDGTTWKFSNYILADGATDLKDQSSWIKMDERWMYDALDGTNTNYMCFWVYNHYNTIDTTIKNVQYYKDYLWSCGDHEFTVTDILAPTCEATGYTKYTCTKCQKSYTERVPALGHDYSNTTTVAPTCEAAGHTTYTCTKCQSSYTEIAPALGHDYSNATCINKSTCTVCKAERGDLAYHCDIDLNGKCDVCDDVLYEEVINAIQSKDEELKAKLEELEKKLAALEGGTTLEENTTLEVSTTLEGSAALGGNAALEGSAALGAMSGCSGTVSAVGIALVASLGACAVYVEKKRK